MSNNPVLIAYGAERSKKPRKFWQRIGEAYPHDEGAGLTLVLTAVPFDGRIVLLEPDDQDDEQILRRAQKYGQTARSRTTRRS